MQFWNLYCKTCIKQANPDEPCKIMADSVFISEPQKEWVVVDGQPTCTKYQSREDGGINLLRF